MTAPATCTTSTSRRFVRLSTAALRAAYADPERTMDSIAAEFGLSVRALRTRLAALGESPRSNRTKRPTLRREQEALFRQAWAEGVPISDMAAHFGVSDRTISNTVDRLGLSHRRPGVKGKVRMDHILQSHMATAMARTAAVEQAAMINAEMADGLPCGRNGLLRFVGGRHAAALEAAHG